MRKVVNILKQVFKLGEEPSKIPTTPPRVISRENHTISRVNISDAALKVLYRLHNAGYAAYLVGGSVRDLLLGHIPKDFDVVTNAHPEQIQDLFRNSYIIGRRFRLVHVRFGGEIIEVATFRGQETNHQDRVQTQTGLLLRDNVYGTIEDDIWRRDFTVNALYYNIADFSVLDYAQGMEDLEKRQLRVIGNPIARYREDPARMLRAIRLAAKLNFTIEPKSAEPIKKSKDLLVHIPPARLFDKMTKVFHSGKSTETFQLMQEYDVFSMLFPEVAKSLNEPKFYHFILEAFKNTDERLSQGKTINSAFLFAVLLWCPLQIQKDFYINAENMHIHQALNVAISHVVQKQLKLIAVPRKISTMMKEIWQLQFHLEQIRPKRVTKIFHHPRFRAAYDFLILRNQTQESKLDEQVEWWTHYQAGDAELREKMITSRLNKKRSRRTKKRKTNGDSIHSAG